MCCQLLLSLELLVLVAILTVSKLCAGTKMKDHAYKLLPDRRQRDSLNWMTFATALWAHGARVLLCGGWWMDLPYYHNCQRSSFILGPMICPRDSFNQIQLYFVAARLRHTAPVSDVIFTKYSDFTANCLFKSKSMRASLLRVICNITVEFVQQYG
ncbi:uncharacterized protein LOC132626299 [Lycium barbarum]|uniref:uncharacterized protein LOC132626299 n=1 Tax=Lycium barbarum TaxID=112863 RepID=UPI00293EA76B|nr:uncharacterized protein LOC132626299 [Lycium barbarum]XP_060197104.1 uncharacterized protein LOC132626299 [Lycium barbarum]